MLKKFCDVCEKEMPSLNSGYEITHVADKLYACSWTCVLKLENVTPVTSVNSLNLTKTYAATDYQVFANGTPVINQSLVQGAFGGKNYISIAYFDTKKIRADLANLEILSAHLTFNVEHWYYETGTAVIGTSGSMRFDRLISDRVNADRLLVGGMKRNSIQTVELPLEIGMEFQSGRNGGIVFGSESANSKEFYGKFSARPKLTFTCAKQEKSYKLSQEELNLVIGNAMTVQGN